MGECGYLGIGVQSPAEMAEGNRGQDPSPCASGKQSRGQEVEDGIIGS